MNGQVFHLQKWIETKMEQCVLSLPTYFMLHAWKIFSKEFHVLQEQQTYCFKTIARHAFTVTVFCKFCSLPGYSPIYRFLFLPYFSQNLSFSRCFSHSTRKFQRTQNTSISMLLWTQVFGSRFFLVMLNTADYRDPTFRIEDLFWITLNWPHFPPTLTKIQNVTG